MSNITQPQCSGQTRVPGWRQVTWGWSSCLCLQTVWDTDGRSSTGPQLDFTQNMVTNRRFGFGRLDEESSTWHSNSMTVEPNKCVVYNQSLQTIMVWRDGCHSAAWGRRDTFATCGRFLHCTSRDSLVLVVHHNDPMSERMAREGGESCCCELVLIWYGLWLLHSQ